MHFSISKNRFEKAISLVRPLADKKQANEILTCVLLEAKDDSIRLVGTDQNMVIETRADAAVLMNGSAAVRCSRLATIVSNLDEDSEITVVLNDASKLVIESGPSEFQIDTVNAEQFPEISPWPDPVAPIKVKTLSALINRAKFAVAGEGIRFEGFKGVLLKCAHEGIGAVGCDGTRVSIANVALEDPERTVLSEIIPGPAAKELTGFLTAVTEEDVQVSVTENRLFFKTTTSGFSATKLAAEYPNFKVLIPGTKESKIAGNDKSTELSVKRTVRALKRMGIVSDENSRAVDFWFDTDSLKLTSASAKAGAAREIAQVIWKHPPAHLRINGQYFLDYLSTLETDSFVFAFQESTNGQFRPMTCKSVDEKTGIVHQYTLALMNTRDAPVKTEKPDDDEDPDDLP